MDQRKELIKKLLDSNVFWSYKVSDKDEIDDETLIEKVFIYLDLEEIKVLFDLYPYDMIKRVWKERILSQGSYYHKLNKFFAWFYFNEKI